MEQFLIIEKRFVAVNVRVPEADKHRTDVLVLPFDGSSTPLIQAAQEDAVVLGLVEGSTTKLHREHLKIIRDCRFHFFL
jgi:hypothetical protein